MSPDQLVMFREVLLRRHAAGAGPDLMPLVCHLMPEGVGAKASAKLAIEAVELLDLGFDVVFEAAAFEATGGIAAQQGIGDGAMPGDAGEQRADRLHVARTIQLIARGTDGPVGLREVKPGDQHRRQRHRRRGAARISGADAFFEADS